jgi:hypothetical protein
MHNRSATVERISESSLMGGDLRQMIMDAITDTCMSSCMRSEFFLALGSALLALASCNPGRSSSRVTKFWLGAFLAWEQQI